MAAQRIEAGEVAPTSQTAMRASARPEHGNSQEAFQRWFEGSRVCSPNGQPLVVFHGTQQSFERFRLSERGSFGAGIYFTSDPHSAHVFAGEGAEDSEHIVPVFLALRHPFYTVADFESGEAVDFDSAAVPLVEEVLGEAAPAAIEQARWDDGKFGHEIRRALEAAGFDGIVAQYLDGAVDYVAFHPDQVRSAFDPGAAQGPAKPLYGRARQFPLTPDAHSPVPASLAMKAIDDKVDDMATMKDDWTVARDELIERLAEAGLTQEAAGAKADRLVELATVHTKLCEIASNNGLDDEQESAKHNIRGFVRVALQDVPGVKDVEFSSDPRYATVVLELASGRKNRFSGGWTVPVDAEHYERLGSDGEEFWLEYADGGINAAPPVEANADASPERLRERLGALSREQREWLDVLKYETGLQTHHALNLNDRLHDLAAKHFKLCLMDVEDGLSEEQQRAREGIEGEMRAAIRGVSGIRDVAFLYDPRGTTAGVKFESGAANSFGGGGMYKVPLSPKAVKALGADFWEQHLPRSDVKSGAHFVVKEHLGSTDEAGDLMVKEHRFVSLEDAAQKAEDLGRPVFDSYDEKGNWHPFTKVNGSWAERPTFEERQAANVGADEGSGYVVLTISNTSNAAFVDVGRDQEIARIISEAATSIGLRVGLDGRGPYPFDVRDINGNRVGTVDYTGIVPTGEPGEGTVRLAVKTGNVTVDKEAADEAVRILREAAGKVSNGEHIFTVRDINGNLVGKFEFRQEPSLDRDGVIDMNEALNSDSVYLADGIEEDTYRYVVTTPEFEPGYGQGEGEVWLVNAKGEIASDYEEPQSVREVLFRRLSSDEKSALRAVVEGRVSFEEFERKFAADEPEID